jgi:hypothetical protein
VKKLQRSFAVEYKSGRRKNDTKPNSIWGNIDLKSVAKDVEKPASPFKPDELPDEKANQAGSSSITNPILPALTSPDATAKIVVDTLEIIMADDNDTITNAGEPAIVETPVAQTPVEPKNERKPRAKKTSSELAAGDLATKPTGGRDGISGQKRGRKAKLIEGAAVGKRAYVKRVSNDDVPAVAVPASAADEMADLLQLEEENQKLRKLLAERLRAENADLRKKLKLD